MTETTRPHSRRYALYAWGTLAYTVLVAVWGAAVRATGSGAGCGSHWPLCNGEVLPRSAQMETWIELSHRATSGVVGLVVLGLVWGAFRYTPRGSGARRWAVLSLIFTLIEGAVGAGLVKFELVATNESIERALVMAVHLVNTFLLLSAVTLTAARASGWPRMRWRRGAGWVVAALVAVLVLGASGAVTALGDTLYPVSAIEDGTVVLEELSPTGQLLVRLRIFHPWIAVAVALLLMGVAWRLRSLRPSPRVERLTVWLAALFAVELAAGLVNIALHAPVWMQLLHLGLAYGVWIVLTLLASAALAQSHQRENSPPVDSRRRASSATAAASAGSSSPSASSSSSSPS